MFSENLAGKGENAGNQINIGHKHLPFSNDVLKSKKYFCEALTPDRMTQLVRALDLKTRGCGFDSWAGQLNNY